MVGNNLLQAHSVLGAVKSMGWQFWAGLRWRGSGTGQLAHTFLPAPNLEHFNLPPRFTGTSGRD